MSAPVIQARLRRKETTQSWGFRMKGGAEQGVPLFIEAVNPRGIAAAQGVSKGDVILSICGANMQGNTHTAAKQEILRAGNELDLVVHKAGITEDHPIARQAAAAQDADRVQIVEEKTASLGGPTYKDVKPKTYQILQEELKASEGGGMTPQQQNEAFLREEEERARQLQQQQQQAQAGGGAKPASIFDRGREDRSGYLHAQGPTIQKAYGQRY